MPRPSARFTSLQPSINIPESSAIAATAAIEKNVIVKT
jgi:hypothetical protein